MKYPTDEEGIYIVPDDVDPISEVVDNKELMARLFEEYNQKVKPECRPTLSFFWDWIYMNGDPYEEYIEISSNQTLSGHAEILDW